MNEGLQPVLVTWYFNPNNGNLELDCFLECDKPENAKAVGMVFLKANVQQAHAALLHIPKDAGREYIESYIKGGDQSEIVKTLKKAKVNENDITRKKHEAGNAIDFLMHD